MASSEEIPHQNKASSRTPIAKSIASFHRLAGISDFQILILSFKLKLLNFSWNFLVSSSIKLWRAALLRECTRLWSFQFEFFRCINLVDTTRLTPGIGMLQWTHHVRLVGSRTSASWRSDSGKRLFRPKTSGWRGVPKRMIRNLFEVLHKCSTGDGRLSMSYSQKSTQNSLLATTDYTKK